MYLSANNNLHIINFKMVLKRLCYAKMSLKQYCFLRYLLLGWLHWQPW